MLAITKTSALRGIEGINVTCEVDSSRGLPAFMVVVVQALLQHADKAKMR